MERPSFQNFLKLYSFLGTKAALDVGSREVKNEMSHLAMDLCGSIKLILKGKVITCTTDHLTSRANENVAPLTVHFISKWILYAICPGVGIYKGETTAPRC